MSILVWFCRIFLSLTALILLAQGVLWGLFPASNLEMNGIETQTIIGHNMFKSDIGGGIIAAGIFLSLFLWRGNQWFWPVLIISTAFFSLRLISFFVDGSHPLVIFGLVFEAAVIATLIGLKRLRDMKFDVAQD